MFLLVHWFNVPFEHSFMSETVIMYKYDYIGRNTINQYRLQAWWEDKNIHIRTSHITCIDIYQVYLRMKLTIARVYWFLSYVFQTRTLLTTTDNYLTQYAVYMNHRIEIYNNNSWKQPPYLYRFDYLLLACIHSGIYILSFRFCCSSIQNNLGFCMTNTDLKLQTPKQWDSVLLVNNPLATG